MYKYIGIYYPFIAKPLNYYQCQMKDHIWVQVMQEERDLLFLESNCIHHFVLGDESAYLGYMIRSFHP